MGKHHRHPQDWRPTLGIQHRDMYSRAGVFRVRCGWLLAFVFFFFFFFLFFCKSLKEMRVATARHWGQGDGAEMEVGWDGRAER